MCRQTGSLVTSASPPSLSATPTRLFFVYFIGVCVFLFLALFIFYYLFQGVPNVTGECRPVWWAWLVIGLVVLLLLGSFLCCCICCCCSAILDCLCCCCRGSVLSPFFPRIQYNFMKSDYLNFCHSSLHCLVSFQIYILCTYCLAVVHSNNHKL